MAKRGGFPGGMPGNMNNLMKQAQRMQKQMEENQKQLEEKEFTAAAGGGAVEVTVSGKREVTKVKLQEDVVDPDDIEMLEDLIVAATNEALRKVEEEFTAAAGGGAVEVTVSGKREVTKVTLKEEVVDPDDIEMLEDLIVAATNEALRKVEEESSAVMSKLTGGLGGGFPF